MVGRGRAGGLQLVNEATVVGRDHGSRVRVAVSCMYVGLAQDEEVVPEECFTAKRFNFLRWVDDDAVDEYLAAIEAEEARKRKVRERGADRHEGVGGWDGAKGCRRPSVLQRKIAVVQPAV